MNKPTNANLAKFYSLHRHTIASYKRDRYRLYTAMVDYYLKINNE